MRKRRVLVAALAAGAVALGAGGATLATLSTPATANPSETETQTTTASQTTTSPPFGEAKIKQIALEFASSMGDPTPTSIEYVQGSRKQVMLAFSKDEVSDSTEVDAIVMHGHFVAKNVPVEGKPPGGSVLILVINATTAQMTDFGIPQEAPNLSALGPVHIVE